MILAKKILLLGSLTAVLNATTLKEAIDLTLLNNHNIQSLQIQNKSKQKTYESVKNTFNPTLNIGVNLLRLDGDTRSVQVGTSTTGFAKLGLNLYDGGKSSALKRQKEYEYKSSKLSTTSETKDIILNVVNLFFQIQTNIENIKVFKEKSETLKAQYERIKTKYNINMTTEDEVLKLQSEYESNKYLIEELKYQKDQLFQNLSLVAGKDITVLEKSSLPDIMELNYKISDNIKALEYSIKAQEENTNIVSSINKPHLQIEDSYNIYSYDDYNQNILSDLPDQQNQLMVTLTYNLFDTSSSSKTQASKLAKLSLNKKLDFAKKQEMMIFNLAHKQLKTMQLKIKSQKSAMEMGDSVYNIVKVKYKNGIVDNITYLDALGKKIYNEALYKKALNDYEIAKANYYFSSGVDYKEVLKRF